MNRPFRPALLAAAIAAAVPAHAYVATAFDASVYTANTAALDSALGLTGIVAIEDFEDTVLVPGLTANLGTYGSALPDHAWDGLTASAWGNALFTVSLAGIRQFGIGISDNDGGGQTVTVNGHFTLDLSTIANYRGDSSGRATYVLIHAEAGDADITDVVVTCETNTRQLSGTVTGLSGTLELANGKTIALNNAFWVDGVGNVVRWLPSCRQLRGRCFVNADDFVDHIELL